MPTFMSVPAASVEAPAGVTVLGAPCEYGPGEDHPGPHAAAAAIRAASAQLLRLRIDSDRDPLRELDVVDGGDVTVFSPDRDGYVGATTGCGVDDPRPGSVPLALGGDGSIALAMLRALAREFGEVAVIHLDAHTDCNPPGEGSTPGRAPSGSPRPRAWSLPRKRPRRPARPRTECQLRAHLQRARLPHDRDGRDRRRRGPGDPRTSEDVGDRPAYLCWDLDAFDPSVAPGVFSPSWGGLSAAAGLRLLRGLAGLRLVAADVNNLNPPRDLTGMTASLAAQLAFELLFALPECPGRDSNPRTH